MDFPFASKSQQAIGNDSVLKQYNKKNKQIEANRRRLYQFPWQTLIGSHWDDQ